jgi:hypothetical protein
MQFETIDTLSDYVRWTTDFTKFLKNISEIGEFKSSIAIRNGNNEQNSTDLQDS